MPEISVLKREIMDKTAHKYMNFKQTSHYSDKNIFHLNQNIIHQAACNCHAAFTGRLYTLLFKYRFKTKKAIFACKYGFLNK